MTGALVILAALVIIGFILYITDVKYFRHHHHDVPESQGDSKEGESSLQADTNPTSEDICCGQHLVCEKTTLSITDPEIIYYDDEELDRFAGRKPESYSSQETEEFRDVLMTLLPQDVPGWAKSITLRRIELPSEVRDELLLIVTDLRTQ